MEDEDWTPAKVDTITKLSKFFDKTPRSRLVDVCREYKWDVNKCAFALISSNLEAMKKRVYDEDKIATGAVTNVCSFKEDAKSLNKKQGAIPKANPSMQVNGKKGGHNHKKKCNASDDEVDSALIDLISIGIKVMVIMRGAPGSGKSHLAKEIVKKTIKLGNEYIPDDFILSADDYFFKSGQYVYNVAKLREAHDYNLKRTKEKATNGWSPIIIDNTNMKMWEMLPYVELAVQCGYKVELLEPKTHWCRKATELAKRNTHGVVKEKIEIMLVNFEEVNVDYLLKIVGKCDYVATLPQLRIIPPFNVDSQKVINVSDGGSQAAVHTQVQSTYASLFGHAPKEQRAASRSMPVKSIFRMLDESSNDCQQVTTAMSAITMADKQQLPPNDQSDDFANGAGSPHCSNGIALEHSSPTKLDEKSSGSTDRHKRNATALRIPPVSAVGFVAIDAKSMEMNAKEPRVNIIKPSREFVGVGCRPPTLHNVETQTDPVTFADDDDTYSDGTDFVEMNFGGDVVKQLNDNFKLESSNVDLLKYRDTSVFVPKALAKMLWMVWLESAHNHINEERQHFVREDERFARIIQNATQPHNEKLLNNGASMEVESSIAMGMDKDRDRIRAYMQHQFPHIAVEVIEEILIAYDYDIDEVLQVLQSLKTTKASILNAPNRSYKLSLINAAAPKKGDGKQRLNNQNAGKISSQPKNYCKKLFETQLESDDAMRWALREFEEARNSASHHSQLKSECYKKMQLALAMNNTRLATYYSEILNLHDKKFDLFNHHAANCIVEVHKCIKKNPDLLDLHYLRVQEAVVCLDMFIDGHITSLQSVNKPYKQLYIITGRGLHSIGGVSTVKGKVKIRLSERGLRWSEVNPGLLKVKLNSSAKYTEIC